MEVSKLSFTKKTQDRMNKNMSVREKGKVLFARLQSLEEEGALSKAKSRADVARMVGYPEERAKAGYAWVSNLIRRGHVSETIQEWTPSGKMVAEYHTTGSMPDYGYEEVKRRNAKKKVGKKLQRWQDKVAAGYIPQVYDNKQVASETTIINPTKIEINRGDMVVKIELDNSEQAGALVLSILKGE